ncbi:MAG: hypothetical protein K0S41_792 [Anaerocolumna sp.]|nr:hypothetical protein [Anaerocolumna sp.]
MSKKKNYRQKHILIAYLAIILGGLIVMPFHFSNFMITIMEVLPIALFCGPYEKIDELVENNLSIANKYTMIFLLITLIIFSLLSNNNVRIPANAYASAACIAVGIRSILFIYFDGNVKMDLGE